MLDNPFLQAAVSLNQPVYLRQKFLIRGPLILETRDKRHMGLTKAVSQRQTLLVEVRIVLSDPGNLLLCQLQPLSQGMGVAPSSPILPATTGPAPAAPTRTARTAVLGPASPPVSSPGGTSE